VLVAGAAYDAVGVKLELEEKLDDVPGKFFGLAELLRDFAEGLLDGKSIVVVDVKGEVAGLAVESGIAGDS
jgi:hypothetical protein